MVDFSRRLEADEVGTIARFNACVVDILNPRIEHHGGRTVRLAGDGALLEFPSAVEEIQCAIEYPSAFRSPITPNNPVV